MTAYGLSYFYWFCSVAVVMETITTEVVVANHQKTGVEILTTPVL